jgi:GH24 family phage-related lysozyme (muramidase)
MNREAAANFIRGHEDTRYEMYLDSEGIPTIAVGFNLQRRDAPECISSLGLDYDAVLAGRCTLTDGHVSALFEPDLSTAIDDAASSVSTFYSLPEDVQTALVDMAFNLGKTRFNKFALMIAALEKEPPDFCTAASEMKNSKWYGQVGKRGENDVALVAQFCNG